MPSDEERPFDMEIYDALGLPGAMGSIDGTHFQWDVTPKVFNRIYTNGSKGKPTINVQVCVNHCTRILHCSEPYSGTTSDSTMFHKEIETAALAEGAFADVEYEVIGLRSESNSPTPVVKRKVRGAYYISDGGYSNSTFTMHPFGKAAWRTLESTTSDRNLDMINTWSKRIESVRKDVERTFGVLKRRYGILRVPFKFQDLNRISNIIKTCCFLHNFHLCVDGVRSSAQIMGRGKNTRVSKTGDDPLSSEVFKKKETEWYTYKASLEVENEDPLMIEPDIDGTAHNEFKILLVEHFEIQKKKDL